MRMLFMMLTAAMMLGGFGFTTSASAQSRLSVDAAQAVCLERARKFARRPFGRDADAPPPDIIDNRYRSCMYAKSGQNPQGKLKIRGLRITISQ